MGIGATSGFFGGAGFTFYFDPSGGAPASAPASSYSAPPPSSPPPSSAPPPSGDGQPSWE
jgi:hypothetical protein